jgi:hypothetical protein
MGNARYGQFASAYERRRDSSRLVLRDALVKRCWICDPNIVGSNPVMAHPTFDVGQVTLLRLPRPLNET